MGIVRFCGGPSTAWPGSASVGEELADTPAQTFCAHCCLNVAQNDKCERRSCRMGEQIHGRYKHMIVGAPQ